MIWAFLSRLTDSGITQFLSPAYNGGVILRSNPLLENVKSKYKMIRDFGKLKTLLSVAGLVLVTLILCELMGMVVGLKDGENGVCIGKISSMTRKKVFYTRPSTKWCGKKKCVIRVSKAVPQVVVTNVKMCCSGWGYIADRDICEPLCSTGCQGGRCIAPEQCQCDPPLYLDPDHANTCLKPICEHPCINAECVANNTCSCLPSFEAYNSTHCYKCDEGYVVNTNLSCVPKCDSPCVNGLCAGPNFCTCPPEYSRVDNFTCARKCDDGYVNSGCVSPNMCTCLEDYSALNGSHCALKCKNCDGRASTNICECSEGYQMTNGTCQQVCDGGCENGICSEPGVCVCIDGYQRNDSDPRRCYKPCASACSGACDVHGACRCDETVA